MASATSTPVASAGRATRATRRSTAGASPSSGASPTRISRMQEKEELRHLNDRLAAYIERVRQLENDKSSLQLLLEEKEESSGREAANIRRIYDAELADARKSLDSIANERARLQIELSQLLEDHRKLQARNSKKEVELNTALGHWRQLEAALNSKEAEYSNLLAGNRRQENEIADLRAQTSNVSLSPTPHQSPRFFLLCLERGRPGSSHDFLSFVRIASQLESALQNAKAQLNAEMLQRVDAQNQIHTLQEQIDFQRHITEQEVKELRSRHESRLVEVDSGRQKEFESKLAEAMQQLRKDHEGQIQQYKEELERTFVAKLENAQQAATKNSDFASSIREELAGARLRLESQTAELNHLQKQNTALEGRVRELERMLDREREVAQQRLTRKDQEMADMREQMQAQLEDYQNLLDVKLTLDMEINAYRKMLEGEEQRLKLSPSPSERANVPRTHAQGTRRLKGKKRKHEGSSGLSPCYKVSQHSSARGNVSIDEIDLEGRYITIKNNSELDQPLGGWIIRKSHPSLEEVIYQVPSGYVLRAGHTLTIWAAGAVVEPVPPGDLLLKSHQSWGAVNDVRVTLFTPQEEEAAERRLVCVQKGAEGDSDVDYDEEFVTGGDIHLRRQVSASSPPNVLKLNKYSATRIAVAFHKHRFLYVVSKPKRKKKEKCCLIF
ncbi:lamin L3 isoform X2 [Denticeps clupeoides]|uniref:lamin L3 isoform X2 n=1 Tax=Denticeps clupeoides TaxID=299321 RepID=UPI0010A4ADD6|nr:lamin-L(III)-like isoform X2 [Denticeps clupeoides]